MLLRITPGYRSIALLIHELVVIMVVRRDPVIGWKLIEDAEPSLIEHVGGF